MHITLLLPEVTHLSNYLFGTNTALILSRAKHRNRHPPGMRNLLLRHFDKLPRPWPMAALTRQIDSGDTETSYWLRADPVHVCPSMNGVYLLAYGDAMLLTTEDSNQLLPILQPLFGEIDVVFDTPTSSRWYLRLPDGLATPNFTDLVDALGSDLFAHIPQGRHNQQWRILANEAQILLHNHPWNAERVRQRKPAINALWFWGGGRFPDSVHSHHNLVYTQDPEISALASASDNTQYRPLPKKFISSTVNTLIDLRHITTPDELDQQWLQPACREVFRGTLRHLFIDSEDGSHYHIKPHQRWYFWHRPQRSFSQKP